MALYCLDETFTPFKQGCKEDNCYLPFYADLEGKRGPAISHGMYITKNR